MRDRVALHHKYGPEAESNLQFRVILDQLAVA